MRFQLKLFDSESDEVQNAGRFDYELQGNNNHNAQKHETAKVEKVFIHSACSSQFERSATILPLQRKQ